MVCKHRPPPPGCQVGRCGWSHRPRTSSNVWPPSVERKSAAGSTPTYTTSGSAAVAGVICQACLMLASTSDGNLRFGASGSVQVLPRSSLETTPVPQKKLVLPASIRRLRGSKATDGTDAPLAMGWRNSPELSRRNRPLVVPMSNVTSGRTGTGHSFSALQVTVRSRILRCFDWPVKPSFVILSRRGRLHQPAPVHHSARRWHGVLRLTLRPASGAGLSRLHYRPFG